MEFRILGSVEVVNGGRALALGPSKQRALLAVLLLHVNEVVSRDRLIEDLWGERAPEPRRRRFTATSPSCARCWRRATALSGGCWSRVLPAICSSSTPTRST